MCLTGAKPKDPGTFEEWSLKQREAGQGVRREDYDDAVKAWKGSDEFKAKEEEAKTIEQQQAEQEAEVAEAKQIEAEKTAELKEEATEAAISATTPPVSTMEADSLEKKRQKELSVGVYDVAASDSAFSLSESPTLSDSAFSPVEPPTLLSMAPVKKANKSVLRRRSRKKSRRSLITGTSGGGIGYYSKFFT
jgi:hypothetical protein